MKRVLCSLCSLAIVVVSPILVATIHAQETKALVPSVPLFNGKDLAGWVPVNVAPKTFTARDGMIISTGKPTGVI